MLEISITIHTPELADSICELAKAIKGITVETDEPAVSMAPQMQVEAMPIAVPVQQPAVPVAAEQPIVNPTIPTAPVVPVQPQAVPVAAPQQKREFTLDVISRAGAALIDQGKMQQILGVLGKYNLQAITQLKEDQFESFARDLEAIGAKFD